MKKYLKWIILACLIIGFVTVATLIKTNNISGFDKAIYSAVTAQTNNVLDKMFEVFTFFGSTKWMILLAVIVLIAVKNKKIAVAIVACLGIAIVLNTALKFTINRARPAAPEFRILAVETTPSFPSGHTTAAVSTYGIMLFFVIKSKLKKNKKIIFSSLLVILIALVGLSRIYLAAHFASDVLGAMLAASSVLIVYSHFVYNKFIKTEKE